MMTRKEWEEVKRQWENVKKNGELQVDQADAFLKWIDIHLNTLPAEEE